jgi:hypothetical protein
MTSYAIRLSQKICFHQPAFDLMTGTASKVRIEPADGADGRTSDLTYMTCCVRRHSPYRAPLLNGTRQRRFEPLEIRYRDL